MASQPGKDVQIKTNYDATHTPGITPDKVAENYTAWAVGYNETVSGTYNGPTMVAEEIAGLVPEGARATARVLDVAAGTGLVGRELHQRGFRLLDALDPSEGMMKKLDDSGLYTNKFIEFVGLGHESKVPRDTYDIVVVCGGFGEGHIPVEGIDDMIRAAKPGGSVVIILRREHLDTVEQYRGRLEPHMARQETEGRWTKVSKKSMKDYSMGKNEGVLYTYRVL